MGNAWTTRPQPVVTAPKAGNDVTVARPRRQPDVIVSINKLRVGDRISSGAFANVYKAHHVDWGCHVAYKKLKTSLQSSDLASSQQLKMPSSMSREAVINMTLRHTNIVSMMGAVFDKENQGFVLEYVQFGSLANFLDKIKDENGVECLPLCLRHKMAHEIASGMSYLHTFSHSPIIHGDLKLLNILVGDNFNAKVCF
jgi:serine/threonine protein kinase